jgi:glycosyltransferase involved in cell wall biosynthesis
LTARGDASELARAIAKVLDDAALAHVMGKAGRQRVLERFTWEASTRHLVELLENVRDRSLYAQRQGGRKPKL